jgi:hypothetical protein
MVTTKTHTQTHTQRQGMREFHYKIKINKSQRKTAREEKETKEHKPEDNEIAVASPYLSIITFKYKLPN